MVQAGRRYVVKISINSGSKVMKKKKKKKLQKGKLCGHSSHLFVCENIKNDVAGGMGIICVGALFNSDIRLGRAEITPTSSS